MLDFSSEEVIAAANADPAFSLAARFWTGTVRFEVGSTSLLFEVRDSKAIRFERDESRAAADIIVRGSESSWGKLLQAVPPPGFHDPMFNDGRSDFDVQGDLINSVAPHYHAVQELLAILRRLRNTLDRDAVLPEVEREFDEAVGRYMYVHIQGVQYRIYYEEAGNGPVPLLLQHTAGADGRQWRHILEDEDYRKLYRIISYDLPFHGKSVPPTSDRWWEKRYLLTRSFLMEAVLQISRRLRLERPVFMGCSVGGNLAPDLAFYHPHAFRAVIAINGGLAVKLENPKPEIAEAFSSSRVGGQWKAALMRSNTAPTSPEPYRRETTWVYMQGAPDVLEGDIHYHMLDHDLTAEQAAAIDTTVVGVYLLTGEYDFLATDNGTIKLAEAVEGSHFEILPGLGHFGPAENPEGFKKVLLPVLQRIARGTASTPAAREAAM